MADGYSYGLIDLNGKPVADSRITPALRDMLNSTGNWDADIKKGVCAYGYNGKRVPLTAINLNKNMVKFIAGLWRFRKKSNYRYSIVNVYDKRLVVGKKLDIQERDVFKFEYYTAAAEKYDEFGVLTPEFNLYIAKCDTKKGPMLRYGATREDARAFLRGAIMDVFGPNIASYILCDAKKRQK